MFFLLFPVPLRARLLLVLVVPTTCPAIGSEKNHGRSNATQAAQLWLRRGAISTSRPGGWKAVARRESWNGTVDQSSDHEQDQQAGTAFLG